MMAFPANCPPPNAGAFPPDARTSNTPRKARSVPAQRLPERRSLPVSAHQTPVMSGDVEMISAAVEADVR